MMMAVQNVIGGGSCSKATRKGGVYINKLCCFLHYFKSSGLKQVGIKVIIENCKSSSCKNMYTRQEFRWHVFFWGLGG
jgi:hypothetical protein